MGRAVVVRLIHLGGLFFTDLFVGLVISGRILAGAAVWIFSVFRHAGFSIWDGLVKEWALSCSSFP